MFQAFVSYPERASAPNGVVDQQYGDLVEEGLQAPLRQRRRSPFP